MALNPAWFNALVDDTGTGTTGTVWNKAAIKGLTDTIDASLGPLPTWSQNYWTPEIRNTGGGAPSYSNRTGFYILVGKLVWCGFHIVFSKGSMAVGGVVQISVPFPFVNASGQTWGGVSIDSFSGLAQPAASIGSFTNAGTDVASLIFVPGGGATAGQYLVTEHLGSGFVDFQGNGVYAAA